MLSEASETILIFAASPLDQPRLSLDREVREIENGLRHSRKHFDVKQQWATRPKDLRRALLDHKPEYVHFCGHGAGRDGIVLEGQLVDAEALAELFRLFSASIKCVVLNACYSTVQAQAIAKHVDYVVGMNKAIGDSAAIEFASAFYDALGAGESIDFAFSLGRNAIQLAGIPEHLTPELLTRSGDESHGYVTSPETRLKSLHYDWDGAPAVSQLYGREVAAEVLRSWILDDSCRVVLITGLGGIGKTDLATCLGRGGNRSANTSNTLASGIYDQFDCVMWRSLLNAPRPEEFFKDLLGFLSGHGGAKRSLTKDLEAVLEYLEIRRCLVIVDNVEAVLEPGDPTMRYRDGYEPYGSFFEQVAKTVHQSCLLLTSREKPRAIANLEGARRPVRSLALTGIGTSESQNLFAQIGTFSGDSGEWDRLVGLYNGNPLALELAARHIDQVFDGDLGAFLSGGRSVFAGVEELLDWHLDRLSREETDLVYWLAIEREPITLATLYDDFVSYVSREKISSTLQSLQRRLPLERISRHHFSLQPVLIERVTARLVNQFVSNIMKGITEGSKVRTGRFDSNVFEDTQLVNSHALVKATAKESVRDSQHRLILGPVADLLTAARPDDLLPTLVDYLNNWRETKPAQPGYAAGNLLNLLRHLNANFRDLNVSNLPIWQACLHDVNLHATDFSFTEFRHSTFRHAFGTVFSIDYSPNGELIAVGDDNGEVRLFLASNGQLQTRCVGHSDIVWAVAFSPDGQTIASASFDNTIRLWHTSDGRCVNVLLGHEGWVYSLSFSPEGDVIASASEDGSCRLWNLKTGDCTILETDFEFAAATTFSPDGRLLAVAGSTNQVILFRLADLTSLMSLSQHQGRVRALAFSPQGDLLATGGEDRQINLWAIPDGVHIATLAGHLAAVRSLSFSAAGDLLASASDDGSARLWSTARKECVGNLAVASGRVWSVDCNPVDRTLATGSEDGSVRLWDIDTSQCLITLRGYSNKTWSLAFSPEPSLLFAGNEDAVIRGWDVRDAQITFELSGHASRVWAVACSSNGKFAASVSDDLTVRVWDLQSNRCLHILKGHSDWIRAVAFSPDSQLVASAGEDGKVAIWNVSSGSQLAMIESEMTRIFSLAFCRAQTCVALAGSSHDVHLLRVEDGQRVAHLHGHRSGLNAIVSFDDDRLASCSDDGMIKIWNIKKEECITTLTVGCRVWSGAWLFGGSSFLSGSEDGILRRWVIETGICEAAVRVHQGSVRSLAVNASGDTVATTGDDGAIRLWSLPALVPCASPNTLRAARPYEGMNISGATGLTTAQREAMMALGAFTIPSM